MAMNKKEAAAFEELRRELALAKAIRWPSYEAPTPMTVDEIRANLKPGGMKWGNPQMVARGWFVRHRGTPTYGCSDGIYHSPDGDVTTSQQTGVMYVTKLEALKAARLAKTKEFAAELAAIDAQIEEELSTLKGTYHTHNGSVA